MQAQVTKAHKGTITPETKSHAEPQEEGNVTEKTRPKKKGGITEKSTRRQDGTD